MIVFLKLISCGRLLGKPAQGVIGGWSFHLHRPVYISMYTLASWQQTKRILAPNVGVLRTSQSHQADQGRLVLFVFLLFLLILLFLSIFFSFLLFHFVSLYIILSSSLIYTVIISR